MVFIEKLSASSIVAFQAFYGDIVSKTITLSSYFHEKNKGLALALMSRVLWRVVGSQPAGT